MTLGATTTETDLRWSTRRSRVLLIVVHVPFLLLAPLATVAGFTDPPRPAWLVVPLALAIAVLQLRHSFGAAHGVIPRRWPLTLAALATLAFVPLPWFGFDWASIQWTFVASAAMLLRGQLRVLLVVVPVIGTAVWAAISSATVSHAPIPTDLYFIPFWIIGLSGSAACVYGASQLVRAVDSLFATRVQMAESTVGSERLRLSRDLHDLLGQSLSAVSLKGDLAIALLRGGAQSAAEDEVRGITEVAREAIRDMRHVVRGKHPVSLRAETDRAAVLLSAASIDSTIDCEMDALAVPVDELLGWAAREGITNMLRHSQANTCSIRAAHTNGKVTLEIINDGARPSSGGGTGISGLAERARSVSGCVTARHLGDGRFSLFIEVPEVLP